MLNKRIIQGIIAFIVIAVLIFIYIKYKNKSQYVIPPTATSDTDSNRQTRYSNDLVKCETTYINAVNDNDGTASQAITNALNECISSNVLSYYNARCPYLVPDANGKYLALKGQGTPAPATATYNAYQADINAINAKYTPLISAAGQTYSTNIIMAARKADFTGATRKYFATLCSDLYTTTTDTTSQALYAGWTSSATTGTTYGWDATKVTLARIWEWAKYAGVAPGTTGNTYTAPAAPLIGAPALGVTFAAANACSSLYTVTPSGSTTPNWQLAADNGPGTVRAGVTFPWETTNAACAPSATFITGATAANPLP
jgi:hypothetical protein